jgi:Flp pilus assembly protein TadB
MSVALLAFMAGGAVRHVSPLAFGVAVLVLGIVALMLVLRERQRQRSERDRTV